MRLGSATENVLGRGGEEKRAAPLFPPPLPNTESPFPELAEGGNFISVIGNLRYDPDNGTGEGSQNKRDSSLRSE
ncbi:hypothetical protein MMU07_00995 [Aquiflexum sp. LQ15W]|nr:hypothetical protein [Cognataquiflexum nitidum]